MTNGSDLFDQAVALAKDGRYREALRLCDQFILDQPDCHTGYYSKATILGVMGRHREAIAALGKVISMVPDKPFAYVIRADHFMHLGQWQRAIADLTRAKALDKGYFANDILLHRAECYRQVGEYQMALDDCSKIPDDHSSPGFRGHPAGSKHMILADIRKP